MPDLDLAHLRTFLLVAEGGSFTGAASGVLRTQPTVSRQIRALEGALGVALFRRVGRRAVLTEAGVRLADYARRTFALLDEARAAVAADGASAARRLRIGAGGMPSQYLLPPLLEALSARVPGLHVSLSTHHPERVAEGLVRGDLDVGLVTRPVRARGLVLEDVGEDEAVAIAGRSHPWARRRGRLSLAAFDGQPFILYDRGTGTSRRILGQFARAGVALDVRMEVGYVEAMKEMVRIGLGVSLVPAWVVAREVAAGEIAAVRLSGGGPARRWAVAYARGRGAEPALSAFAAVCREALPARLAGPFRRGRP